MKQLIILFLTILTTTMKAQTISDTVLNKVNNDRQFFETLGEIYPVNNNVAVTQTTISGIKCFWFRPKNENKENIIVYLHGGSYALGNINSHQSMVSHIAQATNSKVLFVEYALAPENPFPTAINQIVEVYKSLLKNYPKSKITFMGDSAGGGLVVSSIYSIIENELKLPSSVILLSPWINLKCNTNSYKTRQRLDPILTKQNLLEYAEYYSNETADPNELVFEKFPSAFILVGSNEILFDDAKNFYDYIETIQTNTKFKEYENQTHVWLLTSISNEKSQEALNDIAKFIDNHR